MLRGLTIVLVLVVALGVGTYLWRERVAHAQPASVTPAGLRAEARGFAAQTQEKLGEIGHELRDAKVSASVKTALALNRTLRAASIHVSTEDGVVTLSGRATSADERARAEALAAAVPGVTRVLDQVQVASGPTPVAGRSLGETLEDETVEMRVRLALSLNTELGGTDVTVQAYRHEVTLGGEVGSPAQRERAQQIARDTTAVAGVLDRIRVRGVDARPGASSAERAAAAERAVKANPNLAPFDLRVREEGDRLVLRGSVRTPVEKDLALALAREAAGGGVEDAVEVSAGA